MYAGTAGRWCGRSRCLPMRHDQVNVGVRGAGAACVLVPLAWLLGFMCAHASVCRPTAALLLPYCFAAVASLAVSCAFSAFFR
jgi:hypothetical protein